MGNESLINEPEEIGTEEHVERKPGVLSMPAWLVEPVEYEPPRDRDIFIGKSILSMTTVLAHFRLDDGASAPFSASAPMKLIVGLVIILLTSLSSNYFFTLVVLACVLLRLCLLPAKKLRRAVVVALGAAALSFLIMLPAIFLGQNHSAVLISTKVLVSVGTAMCVTLSTPFNQLTGALRVFRVPSLFIMTIDLTLKNIVRLGEVAVEILTALKLRSVGRNRDKGSALGGVGGVVFLKSNEAAKETFDAMTCRGFEGDYPVADTCRWRKIDILWALYLVAMVAAFAYLQGAM